MFTRVRLIIVETEGLSGLKPASEHRVCVSTMPAVHGYPESRSATPESQFAMIGDGATSSCNHFGRPLPDLADQPDYEATLVAGLNETIKPGDSVVVVGGFPGVTAVVAALRTVCSGTVLSGGGKAKEHVSFVRKRSANGRTNVAVHHAVVAKAIAVYTTGSDVGN